MDSMDFLQPHGRYAATVEGYDSNGNGVVRIGGAVVFVPRAVRGEEIELEITKVMKSAAAGEITRILKPSPRRQNPDCPYFGTCGGCDFRHLSYEEELWAKRRRVEDSLRRLGGAAVEIGITGAVHFLRYRNKCQFPVGPDGAAGFYQARSHTVVPVSDCLLQPEISCHTAGAVRDWMRRYGVPAYDERTESGLIRYVYTRTNQAGESLCCVIANGKRLPKEPELAGLVREAVPGTVGVLLNTNLRRDNVILGERYRTIWGQDFLTETLCGLEFRLSVPSFFQVNREQAEILYSIALDYAGLTDRETALDLYCGIGTITLCMAGRARRVLGAEIIPAAVRDARANARRNGIANAEFFCADAAETAARLAREGPRPDVVTVDPPRKGLTPEGIGAIVSMGPERVVYVSCDPGTLGRDVQRFRAAGYGVAKAAAVDLFPRTRHVESVVLLTRLAAGVENCSF